MTRYNLKEKKKKAQGPTKLISKDKILKKN
jgi:hypothetical protein